MPDALGFIFNAAGLIVPFTLEAKYATRPLKEATSLQIVVGSSTKTASGDVPHVALWRKMMAAASDSGTPGNMSRSAKATSRRSTRTHNKQADPCYVTLGNLKNGAIGITAVTMANQKVSATFSGVYGLHVWPVMVPEPELDWLQLPEARVRVVRGATTATRSIPGCSPSISTIKRPRRPGIDQYPKRPEKIWLCNSTPLFSFSGNLLPNGIVPFFQAQAAYKDGSRDSGEGAHMIPGLVVDKKNQYNKTVYPHQKERGKRET
ncbi:hypothetical protein E4U54_004208 [Claviceps lovelessii]|nr:hypothetical protein E4U54_004208 [Claviceps lovelessii]